MPIVTDGAMMSPEPGIHELGASFGESIGATAAQAWSDSPLSQLMTGSAIADASGEMPDMGRLNDPFAGGVDLTEQVKPAVPRLDMIDAIDRVKKAGLDKQLTLPNQPDMPQAQLEIMIRNAKARAEREATVERGPQGFIPSALQVGTSFLVGAADPINLASAFIPIMGELRYGKLLAAAGDSVTARLATRAAVGAGQGAVGQAALEPLDWWAHTQEGRDFGMSDVLHNIMFGAALGGALQGGGGFISDAYRARQGRALYPFGPGEVLARVPDVEAAPAAPQAADVPFLRIEPGAPEESPAAVGSDAELDAVVSGIEREYAGPPSPEVETINDLPPRAHEDAMRVAISDLVNGEPVRAGDVIAAAARSDARIAESMEAGSRDAIGARVAEVTAEARRVGSLMELADEWRANPDAVYSRLDRLRQDVVSLERDLKKKYGVRRVEDLDDAPLTDAERHFLFYETAPADRQRIDEIIQQLQPVDSLDDAAREIAYEFRRLPQDMRRLSSTEQHAVMRLQVLFNEVQRLGGDLNEVLKDAGGRYAARFGDPEDAFFMAGDAAERLRKMFGEQEPEAVAARTVQPLALPAPESPVRPVQKAARGRAAADPETWSLFELLAHEGGLHPDPELQAIFGSAKSPFVPGFGALVRKNGRTLDDALRLAKDHGYLFDETDVSGATPRLTPNDLLDRLAEENAGRRQYKLDQQHATKAEVQADLERERHEIMSALHDEIEAATGQKGVQIDPILEKRVVEIVQKEGESDVLAAYERAIMEDAERYEAISRERQQHPETAHIAGWDPDEPAGAPADGGAVAGQRGQPGLPDQGPGRADGVQPRAGRTGDRGAIPAELTKAADWRAVSAARPDFNDPDVIAASNAAAKVEPPPSKLDERVAAAEKADAYAKSLYDMFAHRLPEDERARLDEALAQLDRQKADIDVVTQRGAACLFEGSKG